MTYKKYIIFSFIISITLVFITSTIFFKKTYKKSPIAEKGVLDLTKWDFEKDGIIELNGEWEFYWERFFYVDDFLNSNPISFNKTFIKVPGTWRNFKINDHKISGEGFATYRLKVILDKPYHMMSLKFDVIFTAFSIYVNGKEISSAGITGKTPETSIPVSKPHIVDFGCFQKEFEIIIHVSNFHYKDGGLLWKTYFGLPEHIHHLQIINIASDLFIFGSIFILGLYHLCFFMIYRKEKSFVYFGLLCLLISLRTLIVSEFYLREIFPYISWNFLIKLIHWISFISVPLLTLFIHSLFPNEFSKKILNLTLAVGILFVFLIVIPIKTIQFNLMPLFSVLALLLTSYIVFTIALALKHNREGSMMTFIGFSILFLTIINDILHDNNIINTRFCVHYGLIALIFSYALILAIRFLNSYQLIEDYSSELKKEIIERRKIEEQFKELLSTIEDVVWSAKTDGSEYYYMSPNIEKVYGISLSEFKNNPMLWLNVIHPDDRDEIEKISGKLIEKEKIFKEYRIIRNDGEIRWLEDRKYVIHDDHKKAVRIGGIARDITERKKLEKELQEKQAQLMQSSKMASLGEISTGLAHEINQPLTYISGFIQSTHRDIKMNCLNIETLKDKLKNSYYQINRIVEIIQHLQTFGRSDSLSVQNINIETVLNNTLLLMKERIRLSNINLIINIEAQLPIILGNANRLEQVFINLFQNSIDAIGKDNSSAEIRADISAEQDDRAVIINFADNGTGIEKFHLEKIFEPFFTTKEVGKGTGLGLSIVYGIIKEHHGSITCHSEKNRGTTFIIKLPIMENKYVKA